MRRRPALAVVGVLVVAALLALVGGAVTPPNTGWLVIATAVIAGVMLPAEWMVVSWMERR